ncbi:hypothetical protein RDG74_001221 [Vibrio vulnificus]|nr:hypothetical protein [Vibrio vulnificus]
MTGNNSNSFTKAQIRQKFKESLKLEGGKIVIEDTDLHRMLMEQDGDPIAWFDDCNNCTTNNCQAS